MALDDVPRRFAANLVRNLYRDVPFVDRYLADGSGVDVIVPLLHSTDLWRENLKSFYREVPVARLLVGNAGAIDGSLEILTEFPRVLVLDHTNVKTLGRSLALLIDDVETEHFLYLQSDVYLPPSWFDAMQQGTDSLDWFGCPMQRVVIIDHPLDFSGRRPLVGAQMGRAAAFAGLADFIDDDFVYRQEEFVLEQYALNRGYRVGANKGTFHFHQAMRRQTNGFTMNVTDVQYTIELGDAEEDRILATQAFGLIKYCKANQHEVVVAVDGALNNLVASGRVSKSDVLAFAQLTNPEWVPLVRRAFSLRRKVRRMAMRAARRTYARATRSVR